MSDFGPVIRRYNLVETDEEVGPVDYFFTRAGADRRRRARETLRFVPSFRLCVEPSGHRFRKWRLVAKQNVLEEPER